MKPETNIMNLPVLVYIIGWILFLSLFVQILSFDTMNPNNAVLMGMNFLDFGVHEVSHMIVFFLPSIFVAAAGSVGEIAFPVLILVATIKSKSYFTVTLATTWIMLAMHNVGMYMADARSQSLPLVGPSEVVKHDWNYVFEQLGWLNYDMTIGGTVTTIGMIVGVLGLAWGLYLIFWKLFKRRNTVKA
jgi:hypothetical protein